MSISETFLKMAKLYKNQVNINHWRYHLIIPFERTLRFSNNQEVVCIDLGTGAGDSCGPLIAMASACQLIGGKVYTIDIKKQENSEKLIQDYGLSEIVEFKTFNDISDEAKLFFADKKACVIHIDTSHTFRHTLEEINFYSKILVIGGFIIFDDTDIKEVEEAIIEFVKNNENFIIDFSRTDVHGRVVIKKVY